MEAIEAILGRRSIRRYSDKPVADRDLTTLLRCAMAAPSAANQQPWQYIIVHDQHLRNQIAALHPYAQMVKEAPVTVIVCGDTQALKVPNLWPQDCSAATQNLLVAAHAIGLGTCWCGLYPNEARMSGVRSLFGIPDHIMPFSIIALGHPAEHKPPADRYDEARIHVDRW